MFRSHRAVFDGCTDDHLCSDLLSLRCIALSLALAHFSLRLGPDDCTESSSRANTDCIDRRTGAMRIALVSLLYMLPNSARSRYDASVLFEYTWCCWLWDHFYCCSFSASQFTESIKQRISRARPLWWRWCERTKWKHDANFYPKWFVPRMNHVAKTSCQLL